MELGSEFSLPLHNLTLKENNIFNFLKRFNNVVIFDSGRSALKHIVSSLENDYEVLLPELICESVINPFKSHHISFYKLKNDFTIDVDDLSNRIYSDRQVIFLMHYFGILQPKDVQLEIRSIADRFNCVIVEDTTHSIFTNPKTIGDYQVCSIRKWLPIPKGGILYSKEDKLRIFDNVNYKKCIDNSRVYGMILKELYLNYSLDCNETYRGIFEECEKKLDEQENIQMLSDLSRFIASCVDVTELINIRKHNYEFLMERFRNIGINPAVSLNDDECPLVFPLRVPKRNAFRLYLTENQIYCAVHWPFDGYHEEARMFAKMCGNELISLPIDQRYGEEHISYMIEVISNYGGDLLF